MKSILIRIIQIAIIATLSSSCNPADALREAYAKIFGKKPSGGQGSASTATLDVPTTNQVSDFLNNNVNVKERCLQLTADPNIPLELQNPKIIPLGPTEKNRWKSEYNNMIDKYLDQPDLRELTELPIHEGDLASIGCTGYKYGTRHEKKRFWMVMTAAIGSEESDFNPKAWMKETNGSISKGILQVDGAAAKGAGCPSIPGSTVSEVGMYQAHTSIRCSLYVLRNQLRGGYKKRNGPFKGRLFPTPKHYYWSVLSYGKKRKVQKFFMAHKQQLPFCQRTSMAKFTRTQKFNCDPELSRRELYSCIRKVEEQRSNTALLSEINSYVCHSDLKESELRECLKMAKEENRLPSYKHDRTSSICSSSMPTQQLNDCLSVARLGENRNRTNSFAQCVGVNNERIKKSIVNDRIDKIESGDYSGLTRD